MKTYYANNGSTYNGTTIGSGYDVGIRITGHALNGDILAVVALEHVETDAAYLLAARYPAGTDLQQCAVLLATNPPFDEPDLIPNAEAYEGTEHTWEEACEGAWEELARRWDEAAEEPKA